MPEYQIWQVRMINDKMGEISNHPGWLVSIQLSVPNDKQAEAAIDRVKSLGIDNNPDGEYWNYPDFTADIVEWSNNAQDVAELH